MKRELVIIRAYGGQPLIRRIWDATDEVIYVTDESRKDLISIGFPRQDAFKYDPQLALKAERLFKAGKWDWSKLTPF